MTDHLELVDPVSPAAQVDFSTSFVLAEKIDDMLGVPSEFAIGKKANPTTGATHAFVGLGRVLLSTEPYTQLELMSQVSVWATEPKNGAARRVKLLSSAFAASDTGIVVDFSIQAPQFATSVFMVSYDFRGVARSDYERDCDDQADNDGDGGVDCADSDCADHPACDGSGSGGAGGGVDTPTEDGGCSCTLVGRSCRSGRGRPDGRLIGWLLLLLGLGATRRWQGAVRRFDSPYRKPRATR